jgi:plasmid stabilization system protein ParE
MTFEFHPDALEEYEEAAAWYEERRYRLGLEFTVAVEGGVAAILTNPDRYQPVRGGVRIFRLKRFPYYIFYRYNEAGQHVRIVAIMHQKRRPDYWRERL